LDVTFVESVLKGLSKTGFVKAPLVKPFVACLIELLLLELDSRLDTFCFTLLPGVTFKQSLLEVIFVLSLLTTSLSLTCVAVAVDMQVGVSWLHSSVDFGAEPSV